MQLNEGVQHVIEFANSQTRPAWSRRQWLQHTSLGFGSVALAALNAELAPGGPLSPESNAHNQFKRQLNDFVECILQKKEPRVSGEGNMHGVV